MNFAFCEEILKQYTQVKNEESFEDAFGEGGWRALVGPARKFNAIYKAAECLIVIGIVSFPVFFYLLWAGSAYAILSGLFSFLLVLPWFILFTRRQAKPPHIILSETADDRKLAVRLFLRFHRLAAQGEIVLFDDESPFGSHGTFRVNPSVFRADHGWLALLGTERGNIGLKVISLRRFSRDLKIDLDALHSNAPLMGELSLIKAAAAPELLAIMPFEHLYAIRHTLRKLDHLDEVSMNALRDIDIYREAYKRYGQKEAALREVCMVLGFKDADKGSTSRIRSLVDGKNEAIKSRLMQAVEKLSICIY